jgi:hypothetical protein
MSADEPRDVVGAKLPQSWSQNRRDIVADAILEALEDAGLLAQEEITTVEVGGALMPVEAVEAYGLTLKLDALGEASEISSDRGLVVLG